MGSYSRDYFFLCRCLSFDDSHRSLDSLRAELQVANRDWGRLVRMADEERLAPALWTSLKRKGLLEALPSDVSGMLKRRYSMNAITNVKSREEITEVIASLNRIDVVPILLKGGTYLFDSEFGDPGARVMRDVDILVREDDLYRSVQALFDAGYKIKEGEDTEWTYCYPALDRRGCIIPVEVHRYVGQQTTLLPPEEAWRDAADIANGEVRVKALSCTHQAFLNIFHAQVQDRGYELGLFWLRQLKDFAEIYTRHGGRIDWSALRRMVRRHGLEHVVSAQVYNAHRLLGLPLPSEIPAGLRTRLHYRRCVLLSRWPWAMWVTRMWAAVTAPLKRYHIALTYGCDLNPLAINLHRLKHIWRTYQKYRGTILARAWQRRRYDV